MKKVVLFSLCAAAVLASCNNAGQNKDALKLQNDSLMIELSNRDAELDEIMGAFNEIQEGSAKSMKLKTVWILPAMLSKTNRAPTDQGRYPLYQRKTEIKP